MTIFFSGYWIEGMPLLWESTDILSHNKNEWCKQHEHSMIYYQVGVFVYLAHLN